MTQIISVNINRRDIHETDEEILSIFKMKLPTRIELHLTDKIINKMKKIQHFIEDDNLSNVEFYSSSKSRRNPDSSFAVFYDGDEVLKTSQYEDFDRMYDTIELDGFKITCSWFHSKKFTLQFLYVSASCYEIAINTKYFDIE